MSLERGGHLGIGRLGAMRAKISTLHGVSRHTHCYAVGMVAFLRYTSVVLGVLLFAIVITVCGEGACSGCAPICCVESNDRVEQCGPEAGKPLAVNEACKAAANNPSPCSEVRVLRTPSPPSAPPLLVREVTPLRI